jgi:SAM-dependent methyltransferase
MMTKKDHWENVFTSKKEKEVSWFQQKPQTSIDFFIENNISKNAKIIDIGGGDSYLIDNLLELGYTNLTLLDISSNAIERIKNRLGVKASNVTFIVCDILDFIPEISFDVWHDRASFHFLTKTDEIKKYEQLVSNSLTNNGMMFLGTFSEKGPLKCSGLEITQYNKEKMNAVFEVDFEILKTIEAEHQTPFDTIQNFIFCTFKKK